MNELAKIITSEINAQGAISFARFMQLALYCPVYGYYEKEKDTIGKRGDYFTSVSVGSLFGELLAAQFVEWIIEFKGHDGAQAGGEPSLLIEAGAHDGQLAKDILSWIGQNHPKLFPGLRYWIVEPSERRQLWQKKTLSEFGPSVGWVKDLAELQQLHPKGVHGVIFSNELLDAMPIYRLGWDAKTQAWFEWKVAFSQGRFVWTRLSPDSSTIAFLPRIPPMLKEVLPDGFTIEISPDAEQWWRDAASLLSCGYLMTIDYGFNSNELIIPERPQGTLRAYHNHHPSNDPLAIPGDQDLTAHVNFAALRAAGEACGLETKALMPQEKFLTEIAAAVWKKNSDKPNDWSSDQKRQFQTLIHPEHLGRAFLVFVQSRVRSA